MKTKRFKKLKSRKCKALKCKSRKCKSRKCKNHNHRKKTRKNNYKKNKKGGGSCYSVKREDKSKHLQNFTHNKATLTHYTKVKSLGKGGYGEVLKGTLFKEEDAPNRDKHIGPLAIKIFNDDDDFKHEKMIVGSLKDDNGCICSFESENKTLKSNIVCGDYIENLTDGSNKFQKNNVIVMDILDSPQHIDFNDFNKNKKYVPYIEEIIAIILQTNLCLLGKGLFYCDYNLGNIAIDITDNTFSLTFLDYGAILPFNVQDAKLNNLYISTYPIFIDNIGSTYYNKDTDKMKMVEYGTVFGPVELYATQKRLVANKIKADLDEEQEEELNKKKNALKLLEGKSGVESELKALKTEVKELEEDIPASRNHQEWFKKNNYKLALNNTILNIFNIICCLTAPSVEDNQNGIWETRQIFQQDILIKYKSNSNDTREKIIKDVMDAIIVQHPTIRILPTLRDTLLANANFTEEGISEEELERLQLVDLRIRVVDDEQQYRITLEELVSQICPALTPTMEEEKERIGEMVTKYFKKLDRQAHP